MLVTFGVLALLRDRASAPRAYVRPELLEKERGVRVLGLLNSPSLFRAELAGCERQARTSAEKTVKILSASITFEQEREVK